MSCYHTKVNTFQNVFEKNSIRENFNSRINEIIEPKFLEFQEKVCFLLDVKHFSSYIELQKTAYILQYSGFGYEMFLKLCKIHQCEIMNDLNEEEKLNKAKQICEQNKPTKINRMLLTKVVKSECPEKFDELVKSPEYKKYFSNYKRPLITHDNIVHINQKYLLSSDKKLILDGETKFEEEVIEYLRNPMIKSLNIKSHYGSGKSQLIKSILSTTKPKRVLWISYRKTLSTNLLSSFSDYGFVNYLDIKGNLSNANFLIIQLESLNRVINQLSTELPSYDFVIMDEIESILSEFSSETMKNQDNLIFNILQGIIYNSKKLITLDGDLSMRALDYISHFGSDKTIFNDIKINCKNFTLINDSEVFYNDVYESIKNDMNVYVCVQVNKKAQELLSYILLKANEEGILEKIKYKLYTGDTNDNVKKEDFQKVNIIWKELNLLIYTSVCEAGVDFNVENHFNKCYGIISPCCNSQRGFLQQLSRVRHVTSNEILLLDACKIPIYNEDYDFYNIDEIEPILQYLNNYSIKTNIEIVNGKACFVKNTYDKNWLYNKCEELNKQSYYYINYLESLLIEKGHTFKLDVLKTEKKEEDKKILKIAEDLSSKKKKIMMSEDIDYEKYEEYLTYQDNGTITEEQRNSIQKYLYKHNFGLDKIDDKLIKKLDERKLFNLMSLLDRRNLKSKKSSCYNEKIQSIKIDVIDKLIQDLGFKNMFDNKTYYFAEDFNVILTKLQNNNFIFKPSTELTSIFNIPKKKTQLMKETHVYEKKQLFGYINSFLNQFSLAIYSDKKKVSGEKVSVYKLHVQNEYEDILELKMRKGYIIHDKQNIRPIKEDLSDSIYQRYFDNKSFTHKLEFVDDKPKYLSLPKKNKLVEINELAINQPFLD
jgi:hypothetical protein